MSPPFPKVLALAVVAGFLAPSAALAQRATYAQPSELEPEGMSHHLDVSLQGRYARVLDPANVHGFTNSGSFALHSRLVLGRSVGYAAGLDGEIGGCENGAVYGLTAHLLGVGARWGLGNVVALHGGVGFDGVVGSVPLAARFPVQVMLGWSLGPIRVSAHAGVAFIAGADERRNGSSWLPVGDEFEAALLVRAGRQRRYWESVNAGGGPALGVVYREFMGTRSVGVVLALDLTGAR